MAQIIKLILDDGTESKKWYSDFRDGDHRVRRALSVYKPESERMLRDMLAVRDAQKRGEIVRSMSWPSFRDLYLRESKIEKHPDTYYHDFHAFQMVDDINTLTKIEQMAPERLARIRIELLLSKKYGPSSVHRAIKAIVTAMRWAEDRKYVAMQNWRIVTKKNKQAKGRIDFYELPSYLGLLSKLEGVWFTSALIMGRAGLRLGEALHLEWSDIQFEHRRILFRSKPHLGWKIKRDTELKKIRIIPMLTEDLRQHLEAIRKPSGFVLEGLRTRREDTYSKKLSRKLKATGVRTHGGILGFPHILRHTFGSHLAQIGVPPKKIQEWMGHEDLSMTNAYMHLAPPDAVSEADISKKLCSGFDPVKSSFSSPDRLLGTLDPENGKDDLSSETHDNS